MAAPTSDVSKTQHRAPRPVPDHAVLRYHRGLLARLPWPGGSDRSLIRNLGITSCQAREGVSTVAVHLALAAAGLAGRRVLLVDANLAAPSVHRSFRIAPSPGLADALGQPGRVRSCLRESGAANLCVLAAGKVAGGEAEPFAAADLSDLLETFKSDFDLVVLDLPAGVVDSAALRLASLLDGVLLVVEAERTRWEVARRMGERMARAKVNLLGVVLNKCRSKIPAWSEGTV